MLLHNGGNLMDPMYRIGEALIGDGAELAHVDLLIGDKLGPVGQVGHRILIGLAFVVRLIVRE